MDVRMRSEVGLKHPESMKDMRPKPNENPAALPGVPDTDRQMRDFQKGSMSVGVTQARDSFRVEGSQVDLIA